MNRRSTLFLCVALLAAICLGACAAAPSRAASPNAQMRNALLALRGVIDREGASRYFTYPLPGTVRPGRFGDMWPTDPWTGALLTPGTGRGHYVYKVSANRRRYSLTGYLNGGALTLRGGMHDRMKLAYDHRGEEGLNLIREYVEDYAEAHHGLYPPAASVRADGPVGQTPHRRYWPSNPWDHLSMVQRGDRGSFAYTVSADHTSYQLRLHRSLSKDYVLRGGQLSIWSRALMGLEDEILRRSGSILAGYVTQWSLQHGGTLPTPEELAPTGAVGFVHVDWPIEPTSGQALRPGTIVGAYTYTPGALSAYSLVIHLRSGDYEAGGSAPAP